MTVFPPLVDFLRLTPWSSLRDAEAITSSNAERETADERREQDSEGGRSEWMMGGERLRERGTRDEKA